MNEEKLQQKYFEMQLIEQQVKQFQKQIGVFDEQTADLNGSIAGLSTLQKAKTGEEILVPMTNGIFIKGTLGDNSKTIVNVGAGVAVEKSVDEAKKLLFEQIAEISTYREQLMKNLNTLTQRAQAIESEIQEMQG